ncbi:hypothetical protein ACTWPB_19175 [Nocardia sp. IBHARD005]|uniref:hypothetical protein n=1 Tax=Nocardia sp. IBHARD005 TaxID=3457765 RepID=UPI0040588BF9
MDEYIRNNPRSLYGEGSDQVRRNLGSTGGLDAGIRESETAHLHDIVDKLEYVVQACSRESIPLPFVLNEVETALGGAIGDIPADWHSTLRLHLVDYVTAAFAKERLQPPCT